METGFDVTRWQRYVRFGLCALLVAICCGAREGTALSYSAKPIRATVVDAETGLPLEGVIVTALWRVEDRGGRGLGLFNVTEAVTDRSGIFFMPGWGPLELPQTSKDPFLHPRMNPDQPEIQAFKSGYVFFVNSNREESGYLKDPNWTGDSVRASRWSGNVIQLERFGGTEKQYLQHLIRSRPFMAIGDCWWVANPHMTAAFIREGERLKSVRGWNELVTLDEVQEKYLGRYCGMARSFVEGLLK